MDFSEFTCQQLWDFIEDPANSPIDRASALAVWNGRCAAEYPGYTPQSGGGRMGGLPPHG